MSAALSWTRNPSPPAPSDLSAAEAAAWRLAYKNAAVAPGVPVTVWKSHGEWLVLKNGDEVPPRARSHGTLRAPFADSTRYTIYHQDGRQTFHELPARRSGVES